MQNYTSPLKITLTEIFFLSCQNELINRHFWQIFWVIPNKTKRTLLNLKTFLIYTHVVDEMFMNSSPNVFPWNETEIFKSWIKAGCSSKMMLLGSLSTTSVSANSKKKKSYFKLMILRLTISSESRILFFYKQSTKREMKEGGKRKFD